MFLRLNFILLTILAVANFAAGQVRQTQDGRVLDANFSLTSGRINTARTPSGILDGNLYVTGQVTGGFQFRGGVGYVGANQLRLDLPSANLDDFYRSSIGVSEIVSGRSYGPALYLSPSQTASRLLDIARTADRPAASVPAATYVSPLIASELYNTAVEAYKPLAIGLDGGPSANPLVQPEAIRKLPSSLKTPDRAAGSESGAYRPDADPLFGIHRIQKDSQEEQWEGQENVVGKDLTAGEAVETLRTNIDTVEPSLPTLALPEVGQDAFLDVLIRLREIKQGQSGATRTPVTSEEKQDVPRLEIPSREQAIQQTGPDQETIQLEQADKQIIVRSLAGQNLDLFNKHMASAETALAQGDYYDASSHYRIANAINHRNPLASVGAALALFAANEPLSSAFHLRRGFEQFPPLMEIRVDIVRLAGKEVIVPRIEKLEERLAGDPSPPDVSLVFLAAFVRSGMNQPDRAAKHAELLDVLAGSDKLYRAYARYLLEQVKSGLRSTPPAPEPSPVEPENPPSKG